MRLSLDDIFFMFSYMEVGISGRHHGRPVRLSFDKDMQGNITAPERRGQSNELYAGTQ